MLYSCGHASPSPYKICPFCGMGKPQDGREAYKRGSNYTDLVYLLSGIGPLKGWLRYKPSNDYERGRLDRAKAILKQTGQ